MIEIYAHILTASISQCVCVSLCVWKHVKCADIFNQNVSHNKNERKQQAKLIAAVSCVTVGVLCWWQNASANSCPFTLIRSPPDRRIWVLFVSCFCFFLIKALLFIFLFVFALLSISHSPYTSHSHTYSDWYILDGNSRNDWKKISIRQIQTELCCVWTCVKHFGFLELDR